MECRGGGVAEHDNCDEKLDLQSLLSSPERDFLLRNNGDQVKIASLKGKTVGLYFSASWCGPCRRFTPNLAKVYNELAPNGDFEIVFISCDEDDQSFAGYFSKMPWLAIPFSDSDTRDRLDELFEVMGIPHLVILDESGKVLTKEGVDIIRDYGADAHPFTSERIKEIKGQEGAARREQSLKSILVSRSRDFVISTNAKEKVPVSKLEGKTIGLYFSLSSYDNCLEFTPKLVGVYEELKAKGENFEVVTIPLDDEEESFNQSFSGMPWLSLPFKDESCLKLAQYFELSTIPALAIIGPDGKTLHPDVVEIIEELGAEAYPFTPARLAELEEIKKAKRESQTLESILVSGDHNFAIGRDGLKVPISDLVGKNILLYFSAHWSYPCRALLPKLVETYHQIKAKDDAFEVIFVSGDRDQASFEEFFANMPWLALPFGDERQASLERTFEISGIPVLVALGPTGQTVTTEARELIMYHGADAYPFTEERLKEIEAQHEEMAKVWPQKVNHSLHEHELVLTRYEEYLCDGCDEAGKLWSFHCEECEFDLHPKCAMEEDVGSKGDAKEDVEGGKKPGEGWACDGDVCFKV